MDVAFAENKPPIHCDSLADLDETLDGLHASCDRRTPILVCIDLPEHRIDIGLGTDVTVVVVNTPPCDRVIERSSGATPSGSSLTC